MRIRTRISLTFILLLIFGVTAVSSYAIMFIRNYMLNEGRATILDHADWVALSLSGNQDDSTLINKLSQLQLVSGYEITLYGPDNSLLYSSVDQFIGPNPVSLGLSTQQRFENVLIDEHDFDRLFVFVWMDGMNEEPVILRVSKKKDLIYEPITTIRWIIYTGMFISIGIILLVSNLISRYLSKPITELKETAQRVVEGKATQVAVSDTDGEFFELANSINNMSRQLQEDNERLSAIHEKQSRFFADITHEIRNPLHTIMVSMELLESGKLDPIKQQKYISNAKGQAERISNLFKDLLTLQRYDSDENFIQSQWFDLQRVTSHIEAIYSDLANEKGIRLNICKKPCRVLADAPKIEQVLDNLISNALKYTSDGVVELDYQVVDKKVTIYVRDTGIGIDREHAESLFDRFYRTDSARSRDQGGTGLGLSVVKSILDAHGSSIQVDSEPGKGSTFWFTLTAK